MTLNRFGTRIQRAILFAVLAGLFLVGGTAALAERLSLPPGSYYTVWAHDARINSQATVSFDAFGSWMDVWENSGYTMLLNAGPVRCSRSRIFGHNWLNDIMNRINNIICFKLWIDTQTSN